MKLLLYDWESYLQQDIKWVCREKGIQLAEFQWKFTNKNEDEAFEIWFRKNYCGTGFDALFSVNYWPMLSKVCQSVGLKYIAWCYDNPLNVMNIEETLGNSVNTVVFFDRVQTQKYLNAGFDTVFYLPLCVNSSRMQKLNLNSQDYKKYGAEVSFVGSLYESRLREIQALTDDYTKGYLDAAISVQQNLYGCYLFDDMITPELIREINEYIISQHPDTEFRLVKEALTFAMASEVTRKDRLLLLTLLGRRYDTRLYSFQSSEILQGVKCHPPIDYVTEMPKVFAASKINLNPVLRCIQSGIPLRALDVMAAGGFLLSSYQPELAEQFVQEEEMIMYESVEDAVEKAAFFLKHEDIRAQIAANGRRKVLEQYSMENRLDQIFELAGLSEAKTIDAPVENKKYSYYIVAPAKIASGGPELAHQLCSELNQQNIEAKMYYVADGNLEPSDTNCLPRYEKYGTRHAVSFEEANQKDAVVVINESATSYIPYFPKAKKALWWMSVDNYLVDSYKLSASDIQKYVDYHLVQSQYAYDYVKNTLKVSEDQILFLTDYTHPKFQERYFRDEDRQDIVLFNPKKGYEELKPLIDMTPEVKWVPLINLDEEQLMKFMQLSKLYIDFGHHPGKDRIPRETAVSGCCVITNRKGSAAYKEDVPIPEEFKFENYKDDYGKIKELILDVCRDFGKYTIQFEEYRKWIADEKDRFRQEAIHMAHWINQK